MFTCPCCSSPLLRHIQSNQISYFCRHCWQDMPAFEEIILDRSVRSSSNAHHERVAISSGTSTHSNRPLPFRLQPISDVKVALVASR